MKSCCIDRKRKLFAASTGFWILLVYAVLFSVSSSYLFISHGTWLVGVGNPWDLKHTCLGFKILVPILAQDFESCFSTTRASSTRPQDCRGKRKRKEKNEKSANPSRACPKLKSLSLEGMRKKKERDLPASYR